MRETHGITHGSETRTAAEVWTMLEVAAAEGDSYHFSRASRRPTCYIGDGCARGFDPRGVVAVDPPVVAFSGLLRQLRMDAGLSQEELAGAAGVGVRTVSDLERGVGGALPQECPRPQTAAWQGRAGWLQRPGRCLVISARSLAGSRS
jgi:DNA-binding XRE family transcriptional regulator